MRRILRRLRAFAAAFGRQQDGNVLILFGLSVPVLLGLTLAAIDYSRASAARLELQNSLDSATLFAARSTATTEAELQALGNQMLTANLTSLPEGTLTESRFRLNEQRRVVGTAKLSIPATVAGFLGNEIMLVSANSEVARSATNVEVGLVLDITGSMQGQPLADLKVAAKNLVDQVVQEQQTPYYSKMALVPYSVAVNVGSYASQLRGTVPNGTSTSPGLKNFTFDTKYTGTNSSLKTRTFTISNCVTERTGTNKYNDKTPNTAVSNTLLGLHYSSNTNGSCPINNTIVPLSTDKASLKSSIDGFVANGVTAGHIGLAWGWYMVSPNFAKFWPAASKPAAYGERDLLKVVVMMTDGEFNTAYCKGVVSSDSNSSSVQDMIKNCNAPNGNSTNQAKELCKSIKAAGITLYTVGFDVTSSSQTMLTECASKAEYAYFPTSGTALNQAFHDIGEGISKLRISH